MKWFPKNTLCSTLACVVVLAALVGLSVGGHHLRGGVGVSLWLGALAAAAILLVIARVRREASGQLKLATFFWLILLLASMLA